jgi:hypothetical protein
MPTLNWIGKEAVVKHHKDVPFRLLEPAPELSLPSPSGRGAGGEGDDGGNLIVQGDNLHALKALLPRYAGQVKCIYIDPPYNTGNEPCGSFSSYSLKRTLANAFRTQSSSTSRMWALSPALRLA